VREGREGVVCGITTACLVIAACYVCDCDCRQRCCCSINTLISKIYLELISFTPCLSVCLVRCPPCRGFTPLLAAFYDCMAEDSELEDALEIVFVSSDHSEVEEGGMGL
jgi:hypothetical protein